MRSQRPHTRPGVRFALGVGTVAVATVVSGCTGLGGSDPAESGPPRLSPVPQPDVAAAMVEGRAEPDTRLDACELLDLTTARVIDLTGADMPEVEPTGSGDLGLLCTYGGPGSEALYEMQQAEAEAEAEAEESADADETGTEETDAEEQDTAPTTTAATTSTTATTVERDYVPDTVAAGVVKPRGGSRAALGGQAAMLGVRYACSEIRGTEASTVEASAPAAPEAPAPVQPQLETAYIDCAAAPTGGGVEVHTILVADNDLWHLTLISPETPRSPAAEALALAGLHRVAERILT